MIRINLLPWRRVARQRRRRELVAMVAVGLTTTLILGSVLHLYVAGSISDQGVRNRFLRHEIGQLEAQIREVRDLETTKERGTPRRPGCPPGLRSLGWRRERSGGFVNRESEAGSRLELWLSLARRASSS